MLSNIERLTAIEDIKQLKARYFRFADAMDWKNMRTLFTDDMVVDLTQDLPDGLINGADNFIKSCSNALVGAKTIHHGHMPEIEITSADTATGIWVLHDKIEWAAKPGSPAKHMVGWGHYHETYKRIGGKWFIASLKITRVKVDFTEVAQAAAE